MKTYTFTALFRTKISGETSTVLGCYQHKVPGRFADFLSSQQTPKLKRAFLQDLTSLADVEPIKLSVELSGVDVPIYDLS